LEAQTQIQNLSILTQSSAAQAGAVQINGFGDLHIENIQVSTSKTVDVPLFIPLLSEPILRTFEVGKIGRSGAVTITGSSHLIFNNALIQSSTQGIDPAGDIIISSPGLISFNNSQIISNTSSTGQAGNIAVNGGQGISLTNNSQLSAITSNAGKAGNITLSAPQLVLEQGSQISTTATATATNTAGGSITLNASDMYLAGIVGVFAETQGQTPAGTLRLNPYQNQPDLRITLTPGSRISASTSGSGTGGDLILTAPHSITLAGAGKLAVETTGTGNAGNIQVATPQFTLKDGVELSASTSSRGKAGNIVVNSDLFDLLTGARVSTTTSGSGTAGNLVLNVNDQLTLTGKGTGLFASTMPNSTGNGGNITIDPRVVLIQDGAAIAVDSQGTGIGGSIALQAGRLELWNQGSITAETASAQGGNISLDVKDILLMRRNSTISATAGNDRSGGDGGNITITAPFIIGVLGENSDITANAFRGNGGRITISTNAIYGLKYQPKLTPFSDITASSQFGLSGTVTIATLGIDPNRGLIALPATLADPAQQIAQECVPRIGKTASSFVVTGRGGIPLNPDQPLEMWAIAPHWISLPEDQGAIDQSKIQNPKSKIPSPHLPIPPSPLPQITLPPWFAPIICGSAQK
jgi:large exoprotein involved in heme utilization and adhesion